MVTMPAQADFDQTRVGRNGETIGEVCNKFFAAAPSCTTEQRMRVLRLIENICLVLLH